LCALCTTTKGKAMQITIGRGRRRHVTILPCAEVGLKLENRDRRHANRKALCQMLGIPT